MVWSFDFFTSAVAFAGIEQLLAPKPQFPWKPKEFQLSGDFARQKYLDIINFPKKTNYLVFPASSLLVTHWSPLNTCRIDSNQNRLFSCRDYPTPYIYCQKYPPWCVLKPEFLAKLMCRKYFYAFLHFYVQKCVIQNFKNATKFETFYVQENKNVLFKSSKFWQS